MEAYRWGALRHIAQHVLWAPGAARDCWAHPSTWDPLDWLPIAGNRTSNSCSLTAGLSSSPAWRLSEEPLSKCPHLLIADVSVSRLAHTLPWHPTVRAQAHTPKSCTMSCFLPYAILAGGCQLATVAAVSWVKGCVIYTVVYIVCMLYIQYTTYIVTLYIVCMYTGHAGPVRTGLKHRISITVLVWYKKHPKGVVGPG